jgi:hypothetical protein
MSHLVAANREPNRQAWAWFQNVLAGMPAAHDRLEIAERPLDVIVTPSPDGRAWDLADLLGRSMGRIAEASPARFVIHPDGHALETMDGMNNGPHVSLDAALAEIEKHTRGVCRRKPGQDET